MFYHCTYAYMPTVHANFLLPDTPSLLSAHIRVEIGVDYFQIIELKLVDAGRQI